MSGRCKACDDVLDEFEMVRVWPGTEDYCELCSACLAASNESVDSEFECEEYNDDAYYQISVAE